ncbi:hypothetical protein SI65_03372 [Aspergillus cristatus]|uniref:Endonuclease/exonuclease/phosphatase domain-containing protein n=1 Tax=Aspergillus cristatus TaxID=573508 RepID=A0A1E3BHA8_ASPCR|nr:hypothetical protein SI65_03372 [Aspergillus cristatus]
MEFRHGGYQIYWPEAGSLRDRRVAVAIQWDLVNKVIVEARTDLLDHPYFMAMDVWELNRAQEKAQRTQIINCYDNWLGRGHCWHRESERQRRALEDVQWDQVIEGRCLLVGDFNAHSPLWNPLARARVNAGPLEDLIDKAGLYINNELGVSTRLKRTPGISIIDLALTTLRVTPLSKRWWGTEIKEACRTYRQARQAWQGQEIPTTELREVQNNYYQAIRRAKRTCWETFLERATDQPGLGDTARCWRALDYTKPRSVAMTPTLRGPQGQLASSINEKETLIRETAFPQAPGDSQEVEISQGSWHGQVDEEIVKRALFHQAVQKAPGIDWLNF